jgi:uncharacterized protein YgbK (DUF1537 family)
MPTNSQCTIGILADDLTSAADGAGPFVERGVRAVVGRRRLPLHDAAIVAVDSGSRSVPASQAVRRVSELAEQLASRDVLYKTVDSTLRGHVTAELEAAYAASGRKMLVFAPAFPGAGRTTASGVQLVDGIPVAETVYGHDPLHRRDTRGWLSLSRPPSPASSSLMLRHRTISTHKLQLCRSRSRSCGWARRAWRWLWRSALRRLRLYRT